MKRMLISFLVCVLFLTACSTIKTANNPPQSVQPAAQFQGISIPPIPLKITSLTSPILPGETTILDVDTAPNVYCSVSIPNGTNLPSATVFNPSPGAGTSSGTQITNSNGQASFIIDVGNNSLPGYCRVVVTASNFNPAVGITASNVSSSKESTVLTSFLVY